MDLLFVISVSCLIISISVLLYVVIALRNLKQGKKKETERRIKDYPSSLPSGWYKVADSKELKAGDVKHIETCGKQLVVFRGREDNKVGVLDALCIHLGANLGIGGTVVGDCIQCPFHMWEFDKDGKCQKIPYLEKDQVPERAQTTSYHSIEYYNLVLVWLDPQMRPPKYFPPPMPDMDTGDMVYCNRLERDIAMPLLEIAENSADWRHFETLHSVMKIPYTNINLPVKIVHNTDWRLGTEETEDGHVVYVKNAAYITIFGKEIPSTTAIAEITYIGPSSLMLFRFDTPVGIITLFQTHLPIDHLNSHTEMVWYAQKKVWKALVWYIVGIWVSQWQNDIDIWEHKTFVRKPFLAKGDGPVMRLRRWFFQFYEPTMQIEYENDEKSVADVQSRALNDAHNAKLKPTTVTKCTRSGEKELSW